MADNTLYNMYLDTADSFEAVNNIVRLIAPAPNDLICSSGTTSVSFEEQRDDVYSRDVIIEKTGFRTRTDKKYYTGYTGYGHFPGRFVSTGIYTREIDNYVSQICITGMTQIWQEYIV